MSVRRRPPRSHRVPVPAGVSLWRYGARDDQRARDEHNTDNRQRRHAISDAAVAPVARKILGMVAAGIPLPEAAMDVGTSVVQVRAVTWRHAGLGDALDGAAVVAAPSDTTHGTVGGWRGARCRCRACYRASHPTSREMVPQPCPEDCWCRPLPDLPILSQPAASTL